MTATRVLLTRDDLTLIINTLARHVWGSEALEADDLIRRLTDARTHLDASHEQH
jgi:hypothetical protein